MRVYLEAKEAAELECLTDLGNVDAPPVRVEHLLVEALDAHLDLCAAEPPDGVERRSAERIGACLDDEPDHPMPCRLVGPLAELEFLPARALPSARLSHQGIRSIKRFDRGVVRAARDVRSIRDLPLELIPPALEGSTFLVGEKPQVAFAPLGNLSRHRIRRHLIEHHRGLAAVHSSAQHRIGAIRGDLALVQRAEQLGHEPNPIILRVVGPGAAQDDNLDLIDGMPHLRQRRQTRDDLQVRVEEVLLGTGARGFVVQVALGHTQVVRAKDAIARARPRLRDDGDGRHAGGCAPWLHPNNAKKLGLEPRVDMPRSPTRRVFSLDAQVERQEPSLRRSLVAFSGGFVHELRDRRVVHREALAKHLEYLQ